MKGWEYMTIQTSTMRGGVNWLSDTLNDLGCEGWELVGFAGADKTIGINALVGVLRRERELLEPLESGTDEGWYPDPSGRHPDRHWSGRSWTKFVRDAPGGTREEDPPYADNLPPRPTS